MIPWLYRDSEKKSRFDRVSRKKRQIFEFQHLDMYK